MKQLFDEAKEICDKSLALGKYALQVNEHDMLTWVQEIRFRAERRVGELLKETAATGQRMRQGGNKKKTSSTDDVCTLEKLRLSRDQSSDFQKLATSAIHAHLGRNPIPVLVPVPVPVLDLIGSHSLTLLVRHAWLKRPIPPRFISLHRATSHSIPLSV